MKGCPADLLFDNSNKHARSLGFERMLVFHPKEMSLVHRYYSPIESEDFEAQEMIKLYHEAEEDNKGVAIVNGKFIGPSFVRKAEQILKKRQLILKKEK